MANIALTPSSPLPPRTSLQGNNPGERAFSVLILLCALVVVLIIGAMVIVLTWKSQATITAYGFKFFTDTLWDVGADAYGAASFVFGTVATSTIALLLSTPLAVAGAVFIVEYAPRSLGQIVAFIVELLVTIPSVVYGLWAVRVLAPLMRQTIDPFLAGTLGKIPLIGIFFDDSSGFSGGTNLFSASVLLAIMILPTIFSITREVIAQVPRSQRDSMLALGSTKWEAIWLGMIPYARSGIVGAALLGLARAIGETMAVLMLAGNGGTSPDGVKLSLFSAGSTIASRIASSATETRSDLGFSAVFELGLLLIIVATIFNLVTNRLVSSMKITKGNN